MFRPFLIAVILIPLLACSADEPGKPTPSASDDYMVLRSTTKFPFDDVAENIDLAITDLGYKIDNHAHIGGFLAGMILIPFFKHAGVTLHIPGGSRRR